MQTRARILKLLRSPGIDSASLCSLAGRYDKKGLSYPPTKLHRLAESIPGLSGSVFPSIAVSEPVLQTFNEPKNRFRQAGIQLLGSLKVLSSEIDPAEIRLIR